MDTIITQEEKENKKRGMRTSLIVHIGLILLALLPLTQYQDPPEGQEGIMVNLGIPDVGEGDENAAAAEETVEEEETEEEVVEEVPEEVIEEVEEVEETEKVAEKEIVTTEDPEAIALKRKKEKEAKEKREEAKEAKRKADAKTKAAAARKAKEAAANKLKDGLGLGGLGKGKGNTGKAGNQGDPNGNPDSDILTGVSTGSGKIGGGLSGRGRVKSPPVQEKSQAAGTIRLKICVNSNGNVISASYTQSGSTTGNSTLKKAAIRNAKKWTFSKGGPDKQCGTITYRFKVQ